jgi:hypothetical protein
MYTPSLITILYATVALGLTIPSSELAIRDVDDSIIHKGTIVVRAPKPANTNVNPAAITDTTCTAKGTAINSHDINVSPSYSLLWFPVKHLRNRSPSFPFVAALRGRFRTARATPPARLAQVAPQNYLWRQRPLEPRSTSRRDAGRVA